MSHAVINDEKDAPIPQRLMRVLVTGATGFIGRALVPALQREGHTVIAWVRSAERASHVLGADVTLLEMGDDRLLVAALDDCDAVINLAGAPLAGKRWTTARRKELFDSRLGVTTRLVTALRAARTRPRVLLSASAIGRYAQRGAASITEDAAAGRDLRASLCEAWEAAAIRAMDVGETRVAVLRFGVVLGRDGGLLGSVAPIFRLGLGGPLGSGQQFLSWIHLRDAISVITTALGDSRYAGAINVVSPEAVTQETFAGSLARALGRPAFIRVPPLALRMLLGDAARIVTDSHRVVPVRLQQFGFVFRFANLETALADLTRRR